MLDEHGLSNDRTDSARTRKPGNGRHEMNEKEDEDAHLRILANTGRGCELRRFSKRASDGWLPLKRRWVS
jgi:hypothetical protein